MNKISKLSITLFASLTICIVTGFMLHIDVNHHHIADFSIVTYIHLAAATVILWSSYKHIAKHHKWFGAWTKIKWNKKTVNSILAVIGIMVVATGLLILFSSAHEFSIAHYVLGIAFTVFASAHSIKRMARLIKSK